MRIITYYHNSIFLPSSGFKNPHYCMLIHDGKVWEQSINFVLLLGIKSWLKVTGFTVLWGYHFTKTHGRFTSTNFTARKKGKIKWTLAMKPGIGSTVHESWQYEFWGELFVFEKGLKNNAIIQHLMFYTGEHCVTCETPVGKDPGYSSKITLPIIKIKKDK
jgi:hypothetical protein